MKIGLRSIPGTSELERAYGNLQASNAPRTKPEDLALYSQWSRWDPRLAEIWVAYVARHWRSISPMELREELLKQPWPMAAGVLLEFAERAVASRGSSEARVFKHWKRLILEGIPRAPWEQYFIAHRRIGGRAMLDDARFPLIEYKKWGYLAREILFNKARFEGGRERSGRRGRAGGGTHGLDLETRRKILRDLLDKHETVTTEMYWDAIGRCVSRRQAERDLRSCQGLRPQGNTRGRVYQRLRSKRKRA